MSVQEPTLSEIESWVSAWKGKNLWGALIAEGDFSLEVGEPWREPESGLLCGEFSLMFSCKWEVRGEKGVVTSKMKTKEDSALSAEEMLTGKFIERASFDPKSHTLSLETTTGEKLLATPLADEEQEWTLFFRMGEGRQSWCTFNAETVRYED